MWILWETASPAWHITNPAAARPNAVRFSIVFSRESIGGGEETARTCRPAGCHGATRYPSRTSIPGAAVCRTLRKTGGFQEGCPGMEVPESTNSGEYLDCREGLAEQ